jgi:MFS family permease
LVTGVLLGVYNNWTGGTGISLYLPTLFQQGGFPVAGDAVGLTLLAMCFCLVFGLISIRLVDHLGRRLLWMTTAGGMMVSVALLGWAYHCGVAGPPIMGLTLLVLMFHNLGIAPLPWLMISELYPGPLRVRAISLCTTVLWVSGFTSVLAFPQIAAWSERHIGSTAGVFWVYAGVSLSALIFGWRILPETKGKTLEQIARHWQAKSDG